MGTITRYVLADAFKVFVAATLATTLLMTLAGGVKEGISKGLPPWLILQISPYLLPEMLRFTLPGCLLFAVCAVFARMSASHEITALKSLGISPLRVIWPVLGLSVILSLGTFWLYDLCATWGRPGLKAALVESLADVAYGVLRAEGAFISDRFSIVVRGVNGRTLEEPVIVLPAQGERPAVTLVAREAQLVTDQRNRLVRILARDGRLEVAGRGTFTFPDVMEQALPLADGEADISQLSPAGVGMIHIPSQIAHEARNMSRLKGELQAASLTAEESQAKSFLLNQHRLRWHRLQSEPHRRLANGFSCLSFTLLGIPVALRRRSAEAVSVFFVCFAPILLLYYPLLVVGELLSNKGTLPPMTVWLADVVLCVIGVELLRRTLRR